MSLATALLALLPLAIRAKVEAKEPPRDDLIAMRVRIVELEHQVDRLARQVMDLRLERQAAPRGFGQMSPIEAAQFQQMAQLQQMAQYQGLAAQQANPLAQLGSLGLMNQAQNALAAYCDCTPPHGRGGFLTGIGGIGA